MALKLSGQLTLLFGQITNQLADPGANQPSLNPSLVIWLDYDTFMSFKYTRGS